MKRQSRAMTHRFLFKALTAGLFLANIGQITAYAAANSTSASNVQNTAVKLEKLANAPFTLGDVQITSDNNGNFTATTYTDVSYDAVHPFFQFSNLPQNANLSARVTIDNGNGKFVSRTPIQQNKFEAAFYEPKTESEVSNPGRKHTTVSYEIYLGKNLVGSFTMKYAPAAEKPADFIPAQQDGKLNQVQNVHVENGALTWNAVDGAERYMITATQYDADGKAVYTDRIESDNLESRKESLSDIKAALELPAGNYRFAVKASKVHNGYWNATLASDQSERTELVALD